jgi:hypothetical protein
MDGTGNHYVYKPETGRQVPHDLTHTCDVKVISQELREEWRTLQAREVRGGGGMGEG